MIESQKIVPLVGEHWHGRLVTWQDMLNSCGTEGANHLVIGGGSGIRLYSGLGALGCIPALVMSLLPAQVRFLHSLELH